MSQLITYITAVTYQRSLWQLLKGVKGGIQQAIKDLLDVIHEAQLQASKNHSYGVTGEGNWTVLPALRLATP
jgi:hypothetical protein